jgi:hypothetical protein
MLKRVYDFIYEENKKYFPDRRWIKLKQHCPRVVPALTGNIYLTKNIDCFKRTGNGK